MTEQATHVALSNAPDWNTHSTDVHCPLCDYNLRGLIDARCPECGYTFDWNELLNADNFRHPWLFEHHPKRNIWSFVRTFKGGLWPWSFWRKLTPTHKTNVRRLLIYWALSISFVIAGLGATAIRHVYVVASELQRARAQQLAAINRNRSNPTIQRMIARFGSAQKLIDAYYPPIFSMRFVQIAWQSYVRNNQVSYYGYAGDRIARALFAWLVWPWATFVVLMVFQSSMRRAKIKPVHVLRCVVYSCDASWLAGACILLFLNQHSFFIVFPLWSTAIASACVIAPLVALRLAVAYRLYLHFPHPRSVAAVGQFIVFLMLLVYAAMR